jgi:Kef-type K+ transport system membrane component KefB
MIPGAVTISPDPFLAIVAASALAGTITVVVRFGWFVVPTVVLELVFGIVLGPEVLGIHVTPPISFFADLGLGLLFFFAGYELDMRRVVGQPLRLGLFGWAVSLAIAYSVGAILAAAGVVLSLLYTGSALVTTAIGTLLPIVSDAGELRTKLGTYLLAAGSVGEIGPVLLLTLFLSAQGTLHDALILLAFVAVAVAIALVTTQMSKHTIPVLERTLEHSSQLAVRWTIVLIFALAWLAYRLGLDLLLGGFAAGMITRQLLRDYELAAFESKLTGLAFGLFVPFFFIVSGMKLDVSALFASPGGVAKIFLFFVLFLVVRGTPALLLYRNVLDRGERYALALLSSTQLPLVVAITALATSSGHMRASTAAALVGAALLSTLVFPMLGLRVAKRAHDQAAAHEDADHPALMPDSAG